MGGIMSILAAKSRLLLSMIEVGFLSLSFSPIMQLTLGPLCIALWLLGLE